MQASTSADSQEVDWLHLNGSWATSVILPDQREIFEWARDEVILPNCYAVPGGFDPDKVPFIKEPMRALRDRTIRRVVCQSGVQCLKTLIGELWLLWCIDQSPGPTQWLQTTDDEATAHYDERFCELIAGCERIMRFFTERAKDERSYLIKFKHMFLLMQGAFNQGNVQRKSIKNQMCSEVWQAKYWPKGRLDEAGTRQTQFTFNSKQYVESQAGWAGDDMDLAYEDGTKEVWSFACISCGFKQRYPWTIFRQDGTRAGMRWEESPKTRRENGEWRWGELLPTIRVECSACGFGHTDDPLTRRRMTVGSSYVVTNPDAPATVRSFTYNQIAVDNLSWFETKTGGVKRYLMAIDQSKRGNDAPLREFFQKVMAEPHDVTKQGLMNKPQRCELNSEFPNQAFLWMTVDVQEDGFWVLVMGWALNGDCRLYWCGFVKLWQDVADKQKEFKVDDGGVYVDCSWNTKEVYEQCVLHGHEVIADGQKTWVSWQGLNGDDRRNFTYVAPNGQKTTLFYSWPPSYGDPASGKATQGRLCTYVHWSNPSIKDIVAKIRDGRGARCLVPDEFADEWSKHMYSERRVKVFDKYGHESWKWERIGKRPNHLWDCFCEQVSLACMASIFGESTPQQKENVPST